MKTAPEAPATTDAPVTLSPEAPKSALAGDLASKLGALFEPATESDPPVTPPVVEKKTEPKSEKGTPPVTDPPADETAPDDKPITLDSLILDVEDASVVSPDDEDEIPAFVKGEEAITTWKGLKQAEKAARQEAETLKAEIAALKSATPEATTQELETLRNRVAEQEKALLAARVEESQEYRASVTEPLQRIEKEIVDLVGTPELANAVFDGMITTDLRARAEKISDALTDLPPMAQAHIYALIKDYDKVMGQRETIRQKAVEAKAEIDRANLTRQSEETAEQKKQREAATTKIWDNLTRTLPFMVGEDGEVLPEFATALVKAKEGDITRAGLATQAFAPIAIHLVPQLAEMLKKKEGEVATLTKQISRLTGSSPSSAAPKERGASETEKKPLPKGGLASRLVEQLQQQGITNG